MVPIPNTQYEQLEGKYTYVGFDIDTTGRRLIDEIVHISAYTPNDEFSQYIMPLMNLNPGARQRHQIRVITVGFFRMLKSMETYKVIKTKTEIATLLEFLSWLEKINGDRDGIIFVYHEQQKFAPYMLIEAIKKYHLFPRFDKLIKAFVNGYELSGKTGEEHKAKGLKYLTLWQNYKVNAEALGVEIPKEKEKQDPFEGNASVRAKLSYEIVQLLAHEGEKKDLDDKGMENLIDNYIKSKAFPVDREMDELVAMELSIDRQAGMREIFLPYFSASRYHRRRALTFRRVLADADHEMETLQNIWDNGKLEGLTKLITDLESIKEEDREELINILEHHFDPEKKPFKPVVRRDNNNGMRRRRNNGPPQQRMQNNNNKENRQRGNSQRRRPRLDSRRRMGGNGNGNVNREKTGLIHTDHHHPQQQQHQQQNDGPQVVGNN